MMPWKVRTSCSVMAMRWRALRRVRTMEGRFSGVELPEITPIDLPELVEIRDRVCRERGLR